jgi:hypothetical protein
MHSDSTVPFCFFVAVLLSQQLLRLLSRRLAAEEAAACRLAMRNRTLSILTAGGEFLAADTHLLSWQATKEPTSRLSTLRALTPDGA